VPYVAATCLPMLLSTHRFVVTFGVGADCIDGRDYRGERVGVLIGVVLLRRGHEHRAVRSLPHRPLEQPRHLRPGRLKAPACVPTRGVVRIETVESSHGGRLALFQQVIPRHAEGTVCVPIHRKRLEPR
jgi:hypothetical protein